MPNDTTPAPDVVAGPDDCGPNDFEGLEDDECCPNCGGEGMVGGCFEDTCSCTGDPEDPLSCCAPRRCDWCNGKG